MRDVKLTEDEWQAGIDFLTATGQKCSDTRQESILLSDTLGVSMLTIALNHAKPAGATEATVFGPFHAADAPHVEQGADIAHGAPGLPMFVHAVVRGPAGEAIAGAEVDVWQADAYLDSDVVSGVRSSLVGDYVEHPPGRAPDGSAVDTPFFTLDQAFVLARGA